MHFIKKSFFFFFPSTDVSLESVTSIQKQQEPQQGPQVSFKFWGQPTVFAQRTHLFLEASKAACFGEQVISLAWHFPKWQLKAELPLIRSSALCLCHQWREYGRQRATHHICKGNSKRGNYTHSQNPCPYSWEQTHIKSNCELLLEFMWIFFPISFFYFQFEP